MLIVAHDLLATAAAIVASFYIRFEATGLEEPPRQADPDRCRASSSMPASSISSFGLHGAKWRFTSLPDLLQHRARLVGAGDLAAGARLRAGRAACSTAQYFFGKITILLYWFLQMAFLAGSRIAYRHFRYMRTQQHARDGQIVADPGARARRRRRSAAARDRERRGHAGPAGRHPLALARRPRADDARHSGARRPRRSRAARRDAEAARHAHRAADLHAVRARCPKPRRKRS